MKEYRRAILPAPGQVVTDGRCNMGTFNEAIREVNLLDAASPLDRPLPRTVKYLRLKEWQAFQIANQEWFICLAVYNTKLVGMAIIMAYSKTTGRMYRYERKVPFWSLEVPQGLMNTHCFYHGRKLSIDIYNSIEKKKFDVRFSAENFGDLPDCQASFIGNYITEPIVIVQPFDENRPLYSHKALMPAVGQLFMGSEHHEFKKNSTSMIIDDHKGYYPYEMKYDWATAMGWQNGTLMGFNLTHNQIRDPETYNENCLWLDGKMIPLPPVTFSRPDGVLKTWEIRDAYGWIDLRFTPLKDVPVHMKLGFAESQYHGPTGSFEGTIDVPRKSRIDFSGFIGMGEQKYIKM